MVTREGALEVLELSYSELPPSVNKLYFHKGGRRILSASGKAFKTRFINSGGGASKIDILNLKLNIEKPYCLIMLFYVKSSKLINESFGKSQRTKYRYKAFDTTNLVKVTEDAIQELLNIPDQNNFIHLLRKIPVKEESEEGLRVFIGPVDHPLTKQALINIVEQI